MTADDPTTEKDGRDTLRLPNGGEEPCEVSAVEGLYEVRCGGEGTDQGEVLRPVAADTS